MGRSSKTKTKKKSPLDLATRKSLEKNLKKKKRRKKKVSGDNIYSIALKAERLIGVGLWNKGIRNGGKYRQFFQGTSVLKGSRETKWEPKVS